MTEGRYAGRYKLAPFEFAARILQHLLDDMKSGEMTQREFEDIQLRFGTLRRTYRQLKIEGGKRHMEIIDEEL